MEPLYHHHRQHIDALIEAALNAADPADAVARNLAVDQDWLHVGDSRYKLGSRKILLIAVGKAALSMGNAASAILRDHLSSGIIISKESPGPSTKRQEQLAVNPRIQQFQAGHPVSDESSLRATTAAIEMLEQTGPDDLVLCLISGGTSALLTQPLLSLNGWQRLNSALLGSGCNIHELNAVRKQLDRIKGGGLARFAAPARCLSLILSDVVGNSLDVIGSGPTVPNSDDPSLARDILNRYDLESVLPSALWQDVVAALERSKAERAEADQMPPTEHLIVSDVRQAAAAAVGTANQLGFSSQLLTNHLEGEAREVGRVAAALAIDAAPGSCLVLGGETTVTLHGDGKGGRNQELALAAAIRLVSEPACVLASFATDGEDGPTPAAGALVTSQTMRQAEDVDLDAHHYLANNDSYHFFQGVGGLLVTGSTGTNVNDLVLILKYKDSPKG